MTLNHAMAAIVRHYVTQSGAFRSQLPCEAKKLHRFIFAIALSELRLLRQFLAHIYFNKFPLISVFHIPSTARRAHNHRAALSRYARHSTQPVTP